MTPTINNSAGFQTKANLRQILEGMANTMLIDFDQIQAQIGNAGERGEDREVVVRDFLAKYLPKKYALGSGQVIRNWRCKPTVPYCRI